MKKVIYKRMQIQLRASQAAKLARKRGLASGIVRQALDDAGIK